MERIDSIRDEVQYQLKNAKAELEQSIERLDWEEDDELDGRRRELGIAEVLGRVEMLAETLGDTLMCIGSRLVRGGEDVE